MKNTQLDAMVKNLIIWFWKKLHLEIEVSKLLRVNIINKLGHTTGETFLFSLNCSLICRDLAEILLPRKLG